MIDEINYYILSIFGWSLPCYNYHAYLTQHSPIPGPVSHNPERDEFDVVRQQRSTDVNALKLWNVRSGRYEYKSWACQPFAQISLKPTRTLLLFFFYNFSFSFCLRGWKLWKKMSYSLEMKEELSRERGEEGRKKKKKEEEERRRRRWEWRLWLQGSSTTSGREKKFGAGTAEATSLENVLQCSRSLSLLLLLLHTYNCYRLTTDFRLATKIWMRLKERPGFGAENKCAAWNMNQCRLIWFLGRVFTAQSQWTMTFFLLLIHSRYVWGNTFLSIWSLYAKFGGDLLVAHSLSLFLSFYIILAPPFAS